jgi:hypothetical protein
MIGITIELDTSFDTATPFLVRLTDAITGDRTLLHDYVSRRSAETARRHIRTIAPGRHWTADNLGAKRTGFLERAAGSIEPAADANAAYIEFPRSFGLQRAFGQIVIVPKRGGKYLTIPATAEAYGRRAGEIAGLVFKFLGRSRALVMMRGARDFTVYYWLVRSVTQPQDRLLLPSDFDFALAAEKGAEDLIRDLGEDVPGGLPA